MEMLVTKFSNGKYRNEGELFDEPISNENVKLMGEMIALQTLHTLKKYDWKIADKCYIGLIKDLHHMGEVDYMVSDGYDVAQTAICFLYQFIGKKVSDIYGKDRRGKEITIKLACYREVDGELMRYRRKMEKTSYIDFTSYKALPMDPVNCFEKEQTDYTKADAILEAHGGNFPTSAHEHTLSPLFQARLEVYGRMGTRRIGTAVAFPCTYLYPGGRNAGRVGRA